MADTTKTAPGSVYSLVVGICSNKTPLCLLGKHSVKFSYQLSAFPQDPLPQKRLTRTGQWLACSSLPFLFLGPHHALCLYLHLSAAFVLQISDEKYNGQKKISWQIEKLVAAETTKKKKTYFWGKVRFISWPKRQNKSKFMKNLRHVALKHSLPWNE